MSRTKSHLVEKVPYRIKKIIGKGKNGCYITADFWGKICDIRIQVTIFNHILRQVDMDHFHQPNRDAQQECPLENTQQGTGHIVERTEYCKIHHIFYHAAKEIDNDDDPEENDNEGNERNNGSKIGEMPAEDLNPGMQQFKSTQNAKNEGCEPDEFHQKTPSESKIGPNKEQDQ